MFYKTGRILSSYALDNMLYTGPYLKDVVVSNTESCGDLLGEGEDFREILVRDLIHPVGVVYTKQ